MRRQPVKGKHTYPLPCHEFSHATLTDGFKLWIILWQTIAIMVSPQQDNSCRSLDGPLCHPPSRVLQNESCFSRFFKAVPCPGQLCRNRSSLAAQPNRQRQSENCVQFYLGQIVFQQIGPRLRYDELHYQRNVNLHFKLAAFRKTSMYSCGSVSDICQNRIWPLFAKFGASTSSSVRPANANSTWTTTVLLNACAVQQKGGRAE